jgi:putative cardiolipin synthase
MPICSKTLNHLRILWGAGCLPVLLIALQAGLPVYASSGVDSEAPLGSAVQAASAEHPGTSGVLLVDTGRAALDERDALIDAAVHTIDAQYYIWNSDASGRYMAARLLAAADRGVRVRILLDDINIAGRDAPLAALDQHPLVEIRVYNPTASRSGIPRLFGFVREFSRLNRRMHNKSFTVDRAVTIVGGRNIGNEYFDLDPAKNFRDRDILAAGPVVAEVAAGFDAFWTSRWTQLVSTLAARDSSRPEQLQSARIQMDNAAEELRRLGHALPEIRPERSTYVAGLLSRLLWAPVRLVFDLPPDQDGMADSSRPQAVAMALRALAMSAQREILIESAYLILDADTFTETRQLKARGVSIHALTNSLASNDLVTNHSGYARSRREMLDSGMEVFELRPDAGACKRLVVTAGGCADDRDFALHSKSLVVDRRIVYVGSFNINLRSTYLNSETALIIDSPALAGQIAESIVELMAPDSSWQVLRRASGGLEWHTETASGLVIATHEPMTGVWLRFKSGFFRLFPMEKYL